MVDDAFKEAVEELRKGHQNHLAGDLTRWLNRRYVEILSTRGPRASWRPYLIMAQREGVQVTDDAAGLKRIGKAWERVKAMRQRADERTGATSSSRANAPSRHTRPDWRPDYQVISPSENDAFPASDPVDPVKTEDRTSMPDRPIIGGRDDFSKKSSEVASLRSSIPAVRDGQTEDDVLRLGRERAEQFVRRFEAEGKAEEQRHRRE